MKKIVLILCLLSPVVVHAQKDSGTEFSKARNWREVLTEASAAGKPIFVDLFTTWCPPCLKIEKEVFTEPELAHFMNANFINVRVQMDTTDKDNDYVKGWRQDAAKWAKYAPTFPTFLFYTADGQYSGREGGYHTADDFLVLLKKALDPQGNYLAEIAAFKEDKLDKPQLLELAYRAKSNKDDSIANEVAKVYKARYVDTLPVDSLLNKEADRFHSTFIKLFNFNDKIIQYIYSHQAIADVRFGRWPKYSRNLTDFVISRDYINNQISGLSTPDWNNIERSIAKDFDHQIAKRLVLDARINWSYQHQDYNEGARLAFIKLEKYCMDTTLMGRVEVNNMMYEVVFKYVDDPKVLKKALYFMKQINEMENNTSHGHLDTYASILYKAGDRDRAISIENKALKIAMQKNDHKNIKFYSDIISRMEKGLPIWK
ncbi:thioredoxin family protein [Chitinophaga filiformis]|uniref:Thioredoxin-like n=1 Tax=Chitinophaga filiformis TaxID=104663 RepID=A0A1G7MF18_CHIFI|nr:thioredoxin family protein [Chitinophaga filiformis]SDF60412.1 Thioredoxin-like [Chitinophaga filiformis]